MTAEQLTTTEPPASGLTEDLLLASSDPLETARRHVAETALTDGPGGRVGLELEFHLVDLVHPARRPTWAQAQGSPRASAGSRRESLVTLEPGGQIELSTPPADDVVPPWLLCAPTARCSATGSASRGSVPRRSGPTWPGRSRGSTRVRATWRWRRTSTPLASPERARR